LGAILSALTLSAAKNTGPESEKVATIGVGRPVGQSMGYQARAGEVRRRKGAADLSFPVSCLFKVSVYYSSLQFQFQFQFQFQYTSLH